jgi:hypothetical protein
MPSEMVHCFICDRRERGSRSKYTLISTVERAQKVYDAYRERYGKSLYYSLMNMKIHVSCYKNVTFGQESVSTKNQTGRPKHYRRPCHASTAPDTSLLRTSSSINNKKKNFKQKQSSSFITQENVDLETTDDCLLLSDQEVTKSSFIINISRF